ncbi:gamma-glutamylcyclotransferase family protein [Mesobacillus campisalis]|uniref:gamma-glutamylcyclotransferase family protein n=1 Tax=Mesobacillus campisalis TaxID=1408103 RepID=UPI00069A9F56|nr:gamma-glutamylcyclotransferase [Mesobacillus campisalis]
MVFVYGTLRKNESNHSFLKDAILVSQDCYTQGELYDSPYGYPFMVQADEGKVFGELYKINEHQLSELDKLEDYFGPGGDNLYERVVQTVFTPERSFDAYVYLLLDVGRQEGKLTHITCCDWIVYRQSK